VRQLANQPGKDITKLDLSGKAEILPTLIFNQQTVWPEASRMPAGVRPDRLLKEIMNPGLGIRALHKRGITGKGVAVAIIDQPVYLDYPEFAGKVVAYHDTGCKSESSMHGPAVLSLRVGSQTGVAPDARVYYAAVPS
jgi:subtilisin family serine protease